MKTPLFYVQDPDNSHFLIVDKFPAQWSESKRGALKFDAAGIKALAKRWSYVRRHCKPVAA